MSLQALREALRKEKELELTVKGRKSEKEIPRPVWFVTRKDELLLLPVTGSSSNWYRNIMKNSTVRIGVAGHSLTAKAKLIVDKKRVQVVVELFRKKYGASEIRKYYSKLDVAVGVPLPSRHSDNLS